MEANQTKVCTKCGRELPLDNFGKGNNKDGKRSWCKDCMRTAQKAYQVNRRTQPIPNPALAEFTSQDLITELRARGYEGTLSYTEVKVHKISL